jgi:LPS-assembly protein
LPALPSPFARAARRAATDRPPCPHPLARAVWLLSTGLLGSALAAAQSTGTAGEAGDPGAAAASTAGSASLTPAHTRNTTRRTTAGSCHASGWHLPAEGLSLTPRSAAEFGLLSFEADRLDTAVGDALHARGQVRLQRGALALQADEVDYDLREDRLKARGDVQMLRGEDRFAGTEVDIDTARQVGQVLKPRYHFAVTDAGGRAERIAFLGQNRVSVDRATYSSCKVGEEETPPWVLSADRIRLDFDANEGIAEGAVLRFYDVPLFALPVMSFPITDDRKSGWLPPTIDLATNSGLMVAVPYYWNIAPEFDATLTPTLSLKRGAGLDIETRYLQPSLKGQLELAWLPQDRMADRQRWAARWNHRGDLGGQVDYRVNFLRVSDEDYWNDALHGATNLTPRLLGSDASLVQRRSLNTDLLGPMDQWLYATTQSWQVLRSSDQDSDPSAVITPPYQRAAQVGARWSGLDQRFEWSLQTEVNRFENLDSSQPRGSRAHLLGTLAWPLGDGGWQLTPRLRLNAAAYDMDAPMSDGRRSAARTVPTFSLDSGWTMDRPLTLFGRALTQTLEPRLLFVHTPWRDQSSLPNFDSAALDFNATTVFNESSFSGVDRVADSQAVTAGVTTRFIDATSGVELARLGAAQRYLMRDQRVTADGTTLTQRRSDMLLLGSTNAIPRWNLGTTLQYSPEARQVTRSTAAVTYSPGPFRTLHTSYSFQRGSSEQYAVGWQWPLSGPGAPDSSPARQAVQAGEALRSHGSGGAGSCEGTLYTVGRIDYSQLERRISGALVGLEYDAGCWVGRAVLERRSTGTSSATTRLMLQLELVGLSRLALGSNPLTALRDNVPGYRLLRERGSSPSGGSDAAYGSAAGSLP